MDSLRGLLETDSAAWYETLPFLVGALFVCIEVLIRLFRQERPIVDVPYLAYLLSEGITVSIMAIYGLALVFNRQLALAIADKNAKILAVAMFVAFFTLTAHIFRRWVLNKPTH